MTEDVWVISAMSDDDMVAELLLRIKHSSADRISISKRLPPVRWGIHRRRSSSAAAAVVRKEKSEPMRCSPKTPLAWNGGGVGGGGTSASDLCEESSRGSDGKSIGRSKGDFCIDNGSNSEMDKRRKKKKMGSSVLMKEEEMLTMKENTHLKKRKKLNDGFLLQSSSSSTCLEDRREEEEKKKIEERKFLLPDLNLVPVEEDDNDLTQSEWGCVS